MTMAITGARIAACIAAGACAALPAPAAGPALSVYPYEMLSGAAPAFDNMLPATYKAELAARGLAIWTYGTQLTLRTRKVCLVVAGITSRAPADAAPRFPARVTVGEARDHGGIWQVFDGRMPDMPRPPVADCEVDATMWQAIETLQVYGVPVMTSGIERTREAGGRYVGAPSRRTRVRLSAFGLGPHEEKPALLYLDEGGMAEAIPAEAVQVVAHVTDFSYEGDYICVAAGGLTALAPDDRHPHVPPELVVRAVASTPEKARGCRAAAVLQLLEAIFIDRRELDRQLRNVGGTWEDGLPRVEYAALKARMLASRPTPHWAEVQAGSRPAMQAAR